MHSNESDNPFASNTVVESPTRSASRLDLFVAIACFAVTTLLVSSHLFFLENPNHRIGGIAWNALFQLFGNALAALSAFAVFLAAFSAKLSRSVFIPLAMAMGLTATYCLVRSFAIMMGV